MIESIRILGKPYSVEYLPQQDMPECAGRTQNTTQRIQLCDGNAREYTLDTLLHEVIHAVEDATALEFEEDEVHALAGGLTAVLLDNPAFVRLFLPEEDA